MLGPAFQNRRIKTLRLLLLVGVLFLVLVGVFLALRPIAPREYERLASYSGAVTVTHGDAIINAELPQKNSRALVSALARLRFKQSKDDPALHIGDIRISLGSDVTLTLSKEEKYTFILVETPQESGLYRTKEETYGSIRSIVYEAFPGGVQPLDLDEWWQAMLALATPDLIAADFASAKEIPYENIVMYTYRQMVADASARAFQTTDRRQNLIDVIPYDQMLVRARGFFADGAGAAIKQSEHYNASLNSFVFAAQPESSYGSYPYANRQDMRQNSNFKLTAVVRKNNGDVQATFEDYNRLGFRDDGTLTKYHYLTLTPTSEGRYRFLSLRSELANPQEISVEGYFMDHSTIAGFTADEAYDYDMGHGSTLGTNILLYKVHYGTDASRLDLYLVNTDYGRLIATHTIEGDNKTSFWDIKTNENTLLVKTNQNIYMFDERLSELSQTALPLSTAPGLDPFGYDVGFDLEEMIYSDELGLMRYSFRTREAELLLGHPRPALTAEDDSLTTEQPDILLYRRPVIVGGGSRVLVANVGSGGLVDYSLVNLTGTPVAVALGISPHASASEHLDGTKLLLSQPPADVTQSGGSITHTIQYFSGGGYRKFTTPFDATTPNFLCKGDYLYYFAEDKAVQKQETDHFYRLYRVNLLTLATENMTVLIQNAQPDLLTVTDDGRVLFSYRSPAGSGFGITRK